MKHISFSFSKKMNWKFAFFLVLCSIIYRGAGLEVVWPDFLAITALGAIFFLIALARFRGAVARAES